MSQFLSAIIAGSTSFVVTNIDDIVILMLFFAQVNATFRPRQIVIGQYLGFSGLIVASLPGFFGGLVIPEGSWIGLLGLVPIAIGIAHLVHQEEDEQTLKTVSDQLNHSPSNLPIPGAIASLVAPQTYRVAAVTFANGGDNIGIYVPLFASSDLVSLGVILSVFFLLVGVWCYVAYQLTRRPVVASIFTRYGKRLVPFALIGLGIFILIESGTYQLLPSFHSSHLFKHS